MTDRSREQLEAVVRTYGRTATFIAAVIYSVVAVVLRVPETLAMFAFGLALAGPLVIRDRLWPTSPSILGDFAWALAVPFGILLFVLTGRLPVGRVIAVSAGSALALSSWFALRKALGIYD
jgi:hypothetical protein